MDKEETARVIKAAGGNLAFAKLLGIDGEQYHPQWVANWKRRGLPAQVVVDHWDVIKDLQRAAAANDVPVPRRTATARARS